MRTRRIIFAALVAALPLVAVVNAPAGNAATCVGVRTWVDGSQTGDYSCDFTHVNDICASHDQTVNNQPMGIDRTGAGVSVCVFSPVVR